MKKLNLQDLSDIIEIAMRGASAVEKRFINQFVADLNEATAVPAALDSVGPAVPVPDETRVASNGHLRPEVVSHEN